MVLNRAKLAGSKGGEAGGRMGPILSGRECALNLCNYNMNYLSLFMLLSHDPMMMTMMMR